MVSELAAGDQGTTPGLKLRLAVRPDMRAVKRDLSSPFSEDMDSDGTPDRGLPWRESHLQRGSAETFCNSGVQSRSRLLIVMRDNAEDERRAVGLVVLSSPELGRPSTTAPLHRKSEGNRCAPQK